MFSLPNKFYNGLLKVNLVELKNDQEEIRKIIFFVWNKIYKTDNSLHPLPFHKKK